MKDIYVVQTGTFIYPKKIEGIDSIINLTLMGAAEFEIEVVKENNTYTTKNPLYLSLFRMLKNRELYEYSNITKRKNSKGEKMYIYCKKEETVDTIEKVQELIRDDQHCKRDIVLSKYLKKTPEQLDNQRCKNFWWDIENDFFLFFGEKHLQMLHTAMNNLTEEWADKLIEKEENLSFLQKIKNIFL